jgi:high-affinity iron transporter
VFVGNALIGMREGLEGALVVVVLVAFLVKTERRWALRYVWFGVFSAVGLAALIGAVLTFGAGELSDDAQGRVGGVASLVAVVLVTVMVFWMRAVAKDLSGTLRDRLDRAADMGPFAVALVAFVGVGREGLETSLFAFATVRSTSDSGPAPALGWVVGILAAVVLGVAIYAGAVHVNLGSFFRWTGVLLVLVAAGILGDAVRTLQETGWLPGGESLAFDLTSSIDPDAWYAVFVHSIVGLGPAMSVLEVGAWAAYLVVVLPLYLRGQRPRTGVGAATAEEAPSAPMTAL